MRRNYARAHFRARLVASGSPAKGMETKPIFAGVLAAFLHPDSYHNAPGLFSPEQQGGIGAVRLVIVEHVSGFIFDYEIDSAAGLLAKRQSEIGPAALDRKYVPRLLVFGETLPKHIAPRDDVMVLFGLAQPKLDVSGSGREKRSLCACAAAQGERQRD